MKIYTVHLKKDAPETLETAKFVPENGLSIWAGIFQLFWALYNKMWLCASFIFAAQAALMATEKLNLLHDDASLLLRLGLFVLLIASGNDWYRSSLSHRGYELVDVVEANNKIEAESIFFRSHILKNGTPKEV